MSEKRDNISIKIIEQMKKQGISQQSLSEKTHINKAIISLILSPNPKCRTLENMTSISNALNVSLDYLLGLSEDPNTNIDRKKIKEITGLNDKSMDLIEKLKNEERIFLLNDFLNMPIDDTEELLKLFQIFFKADNENGLTRIEQLIILDITDKLKEMKKSGSIESRPIQKKTVKKRQVWEMETQTGYTAKDILERIDRLEKELYQPPKKAFDKGKNEQSGKENKKKEKN